MSAEINDIICEEGTGAIEVNVHVRDGQPSVNVRCKVSDLRSYTALQHAILTQSGLLWRCDRIEYARARDRRREFLDVIEEALAAGRQAAIEMAVEKAREERGKAS